MSLRNLSWLFLGGLASILSGCHNKDTPVQKKTYSPHYQLGNAWHGRDAWFYPYEQFSYHASGIASREVPPAGSPIADDGELWTAEGMTGSHQTLQLPSIVTVHNLDNGRIVKIKLTRRGPDTAGRVIALSPKAADLLGITSTGAVEVVEDEVASRSIVETLNGAFKLDVQSAPLGNVTAQDLNSRSTQIFGSDLQTRPHESQNVNLPAVWTQGAIKSYRLYLLLGKFSTHVTAQQVARRCNAEAIRESDMTGLNWSVKSGPYTELSYAEEALHQSHACGVEGARIIVE